MINFDLNAAYFCIEIIHNTQKILSIYRHIATFRTLSSENQSNQRLPVKLMPKMYLKRLSERNTVSVSAKIFTSNERATNLL